MVLVLAVGTSRVACAAAAAAAACYSARCYFCMLLAALLVAAVHCLLYVCEYGLLMLPKHITERLAAACYVLWYTRPFLTKYVTCEET